MEDTFFSICLYFVITFYFLHAWMANWLSITSLAHHFFSFKILWFIFSMPLGISHCKRIVWSQPIFNFFVSNMCFLEDFLLDGFVYSCKSNILLLLDFFSIILQAPFNQTVIFDRCVHIYYITKCCWFFTPNHLWNLSHFPPLSSKVKKKKSTVIFYLDSYSKSLWLTSLKKTLHRSKINYFPPKFKSVHLTYLLKWSQWLLKK